MHVYLTGKVAQHSAVPAATPLRASRSVYQKLTKTTSRFQKQLTKTTLRFQKTINKNNSGFQKNKKEGIRFYMDSGASIPRHERAFAMAVFPENTSESLAFFSSISSTFKTGMYL